MAVSLNLAKRLPKRLYRSSSDDISCARMVLVSGHGAGRVCSGVSASKR